MNRIHLIGDTIVEAKLMAYPQRLHANVVKAMTFLGIRLHSIVVEDKLSGQVLKRQSGKLATAQNWDVKDSGETVTTQVGFNSGTVPYGKFHEFGVSHSWLIEAKNAQALRFEIGGKAIFRKSVIHPPLPERSFLRSALKDINPEVMPVLDEATRDNGF